MRRAHRPPQHPARTPRQTGTVTSGDSTRLAQLIHEVEHYRANYEPALTVSTLAPHAPFLLSLPSSQGAVACLELLLWALDQVGLYNKARELAAQALGNARNRRNSIFWNRCAFLANRSMCDSTDVGQSARWLAGALEAINNTDLAHEVYRLDHTIVHAHIMNVIKHFPLGDALTLQRFIMKLTHEEMRTLARAQALYNVGLSNSGDPPSRYNIRQRPKVVFTGEDFNNRPTGLLIRRFIDHPPGDMELSIIQIGAKTRITDAYSFRGAGITYHEVSKSEDARKILESEKFDVIVDTKGLMFKNHCNLLMPRRAPVQIHWLAYPGTIGVDTVDYAIGDCEVTPRNPDRQEMIEKIIRVPESYQINDDAYKIQDISGQPAFRRTPDRKLIACVNMNYKVCVDTVRAWITILRAVPDADIAIVCRSEEAISNFRKAFSAGRISADRVNAHLGQPRDKFISNLHSEVDVVVDPFRCPGHTTASDCYTAGVPVVSLWTDTYYGRVAKSLATQMGLATELTAYSAADYAQKVIALLQDEQRLSAIRAKIRYQRRWSTLYDPARYMDHFWRGIRIALQRAKGQERAKDIDILAKERFPKTLKPSTSSFVVRDNSNKACTRFLFDAHEVLVSPWHGEVWVNGMLKSSSFATGSPPSGTTIRSYNKPLVFYETKRGTVALKGAQPLMLNIPYPRLVRVEAATSRIK